MQKVVPVHETALRELPKRDPEGGGLGVIAQIFPFHLSTRGSALAGPFVYEPTATQDVMLVHDTPSRVSPLFPGLWLPTTDHERPLHLCTSVRWSWSNGLFEYAPAAMQKLAFVQETASRASALDPGFLLAVTVQEPPRGERNLEALDWARCGKVEPVVARVRLVEAPEVPAGQDKIAKTATGSVRTRSTCKA
jgi:hypothetical protein